MSDELDFEIEFSAINYITQFSRFPLLPSQNVKL